HEIIRSKADMSQDVGTLSLSLYTSHYDEIELLEQMLTAWGAEVPGEEGGSGSGGDGDDGAGDGGDAEADEESEADSGDGDEVVSTEQIRELGRASGDAANAMYLELMIDLHEARSAIAEDVILEGENPDLVDLAQTMLTN